MTRQLRGNVMERRKKIMNSVGVHAKGGTVVVAVVDDVIVNDIVDGKGMM